MLSEARVREANSCAVEASLPDLKFRRPSSPSRPNNFLPRPYRRAFRETVYGALLH